MSYFASQPSVAAYLDGPRRMPMTPNEVGDKPWKLEGYDFVAPMRVGSYETIWEAP